MKARTLRGFSAVEVLAVVAVVVLAGTLGVVYFNKHQSQAAKNTTTTKQKPTVAVAKTEATTVKAELDKMNIDKELDTSDIDAALQ